MNAKAIFATLFVFIGCCANVIFLEKIIKLDPGAGNLITFLQFLFISLEGLIFTSKFFTKPRKIPLTNYLFLVIMFYISSVCNNYAFDFNIPMPLHIIFRSGSLITNMLMGIVILKKTYHFRKYLSVLMISFGIILCTIMTKREIDLSMNKNDEENPREGLIKDDETLIPENNTPNEYETMSDNTIWSIGIGLLTLALLVTARMGLYQEVLYKRYGKYPKEVLFYTHCLPLPLFAIMYTNILEHIEICSITTPILLPLINISIPEAWLYLIGNVLTQYLCIRSVYNLTAECSSLTVTLVVTLRKFASLIISIIYFQNHFTIYHWFGTALVFCGTILFMEIFSKKTNSDRISKQTNIGEPFQSRKMI